MFFYKYRKSFAEILIAYDGVKNTILCGMRRVAILTAGGIAPCLSSAIAALIQEYDKVSPEIEMICYRDGYKGLLLGDSVNVTHGTVESAEILYKFGGSPIGNSRVKLTNVEDCVKRGFIKEGQIPLNVAAEQLVKDKIDVLHTIGGDDTNTVAAELARYLEENGYKLQVIGLPKTIDNDIIPIAHSLGANTAAEQTAVFFEHIVAETTANPKMFIVHEVMGRKCGWLAAVSAVLYTKRLQEREFISSLGMSKEKYSIHGIYVPEMQIDIEKEATRLAEIMETVGCVNIFVSEGACVDEIVSSIEAGGESVPRDAFGHVKLDFVNPGQWFGSQFAKRINAEKVLVQKSGYFARSAPSNLYDIALINDSAAMAVKCATNGESGVIGLDEEDENQMACIDFQRIKGGRPFNVHKNMEFVNLLRQIGQL
ncbi:MAG: pyrophosphate--fructose-6-phosphate 1-phosphotransferase [Puniceicoccales bacterium]|jgi:pyrophosphate--fructose-6-phosphate 1-phosphotransferase|nr:pyrophosphate--fructose-6-phosphate 1-phosphotransferase [Puniceicoccales bacterium]